MKFTEAEKVRRHYADLEYIYQKSIEKYPESAGTEYIKGYRQAIIDIFADLDKAERSNRTA